jgi:hypothetical protein
LSLGSEDRSVRPLPKGGGSRAYLFIKLLAFLLAFPFLEIAFGEIRLLLVVLFVWTAALGKILIERVILL